MFDLGWPELMLIMVVALIVIGPKELPNAIRTVMGVVRKLRATAREFQSGIDDLARESGLDEMKRDLKDNIEYYDPGKALESIEESDKDFLGLEDDPLAAGNSILDPSMKPDITDPEETPGPADGAADNTPVSDKAPEADKARSSGDAPS